MRRKSTMKRTFLSGLVLSAALLLAALIGPASVAAAGPIGSTACSDGPLVTCNLWARTGTLALPGTSVTVWGFSETAVGGPVVPGPTLIVDQGDTVTVNLTNSLTQPTAIVFGGQAMTPDLTGVAPGGTRAYTFTATQPGTYLYEAGLLPGTQYQVAMGLHGVLIVRPSGAAGQAFGDPATAFDDEALVVLEEIDPNLNNNAAPWTVDLRAFAPKFFLVNGQAYTSAAPSITTTSGNRLLLRYANAGILHHSIGALGLHQQVLAADGSQLPAPRTIVAETLAQGQSADVLVAVPAAAAASTKYPLYDAALALNNSNASGIGGMLAIIDAAGTAGGDVVGPTASGVSVTETAPGSGLYTVSASVSDAATGNAAIAGAEYRIDSAAAAPTAMTAADAAFDSPTEAVTSATGAIDTTGWSSGSHPIYVRGRDALGNWGANVSATIVIDRAGPTTSALTLTPNPTGPSTSVALAATGSDVASGNNNVVDAEYFIGAPGVDGSGTHLALNKVASVVSMTATIPAQASTVNVSVHARDAAGNRGAYATATLTIDGAGPAVTGLAPHRRPTTEPTVRRPATRRSGSRPPSSDVASGGSRIATGEGFIDGAVVNGAGFPFSGATARQLVDRARLCGRPPHDDQRPGQRQPHDPGPRQGRGRQLGRRRDPDLSHRPHGTDVHEHQPRPLADARRADGHADRERVQRSALGRSGQRRRRRRVLGRNDHPGRRYRHQVQRHRGLDPDELAAERDRHDRGPDPRRSGQLEHRHP